MPEAKRKRLTFLSALIDVGAEVVSLAMEAGGALLASRAPDALADKSILSVRALAGRGADNSQTIHDCPCWRTFASIDRHAALAQTHDAAEDGLIARAAVAAERIREIARGMNRALTRELAKRGWTGGHSS